MLKFGAVTIDVSHLSGKSFWDVAGKATKPFIASHSNSSMIYNHPRNLTDTQLRTIISSGGIVGVNFVGKHLSALLAEGNANENKVYETVCTHIEHFLSIDFCKFLSFFRRFFCSRSEKSRKKS